MVAALETAGLGGELCWAGATSLCEQRPRIGMIGTRQPSPESVAAIEALAGRLIAGDAVVVSGAAQGTDMAAHRGALGRGGKTIVCVPRGLGDIRWANWRKEFVGLEESGLLLLLAPFAVYQPMTRQTPIVRNRLIAGLSDALVVGEARKDSGTQWCVQFAQRIGVPIFYLRQDEPTNGELGAVGRNETSFSLDDAFGEKLVGTILARANLYTRERQRAARAQMELFDGGSE